jgi:hypothetical protein
VRENHEPDGRDYFNMQLHAQKLRKCACDIEDVGCTVHDLPQLRDAETENQNSSYTRVRETTPPIGTG